MPVLDLDVLHFKTTSEGVVVAHVLFVKLGGYLICLV